MEKKTVGSNIPEKGSIFNADYSDKSSLFINLTRYNKRKIYYKHVHANIEIGVITSGKGRLYYDNTWYPVSKGDGYFLDSMTPHGHQPDKNCHVENLWVHIKYETLEALAPNDKYIQIIQPFLFLKTSSIIPVLYNAKAFHSILLQAYDAFYSKDPYGYFSAWSFIIRAFIEIGRCTLESRDKTIDTRLLKNCDVINRALKFIREKYLKALTLQEIADYTGISTSGLSSLFHSFMHISPIAYRNKLRINLSLEMLCATTKSIEEIASECGFDNISHFRRQFKRFTEQNPSDVRSFIK